jgi:hypothetical protein
MISAARFIDSKAQSRFPKADIRELSRAIDKAESFEGKSDQEGLEKARVLS